MAHQVSGRPAPRTRARRGCRSRAISARSRPNETIASCRIAAPATIDLPSSRRHRRQGVPLGARHRGEPVQDRGGVGGREPRAVDQVGVVAIEPQGERLDRDRGARDRHERACVRHRDGHGRELRRDRIAELGELTRSRRVVPQVALGHPDRPHPHRDGPVDPSVGATGHELGRTTADVHHGERAELGVESGDRAARTRAPPRAPRR